MCTPLQGLVQFAIHPRVRLVGTVSPKLYKVSPLQNVTLMAHRRVLPPGKLRCTCASVTDDDDRRQKAKQCWSPTLCVGGPVMIYVQNITHINNHCFLLRSHLLIRLQSFQQRLPHINHVTTQISNNNKNIKTII